MPLLQVCQERLASFTFRSRSLGPANMQHLHSHTILSSAKSLQNTQRSLLSIAVVAGQVTLAYHVSGHF